MTATKKLTRAEACLALAFQMGYTQNRIPDTVGFEMLMSPTGELLREVPSFFNDRDSAVQLVRWFVANYNPVSFLTALEERLKPTEDGARRIVGMMLADPEDQTLAICAAIGLGVEDETK